MLHTFAADSSKFDLMCFLIDVCHADTNAPSLPVILQGYLNGKTKMNPWIPAYPRNRWKNETVYHLPDAIHNCTPLFEVNRIKLFKQVTLDALKCRV